MASGQLDGILRHIQTLAGSAGGEERSDRQLLDRFVGARDDGAFAGLVRRHGPLVWGVCQRLLRHLHDAEDAFQATFVVLARKAVTLQGHESIGPWLYQVACRLARRMQADAARRRDRETHVPPKQSEDPQAEVTWREVRAVLDEELSRLPERYRAPLVLCYLAGQTRDEAAQQLGWSLGTVKGRLERGRELLRHRLRRRGLALSAALFGGLLAQDALAAHLPAVLGVATVRMALAESALTEPVAALVRGTMKALAARRLKTMLAFALLVSVALAAGGTLLHQALAAPPEAKREEGPKPVVQEDAKPQAEQARQARTDRYGDPLPEGALARLGTVRLRSGHIIFSAALAADGKTVVAAGWDRSVRLFETATGKEVRQFQAGPETPNGFDTVALAPDGQTIAATSGRYVVLWDAGSARQIGLLKGHGLNKIHALAFSPDSKLLASGGDDKTVCLWDVVRRQRLHSLDKHTERVTAVLFSHDGKVLLSGSADKTIRLWEPATGKELRVLTGQPSAVQCLALAPDGKLLAWGGEDNLVHLLDLSTGAEVRSLKGNRYPVESVAFAPDGKTVAAAGADTIYLWDTVTGKEQRHLDGHHDAIPFVGFVSNQLLASAGHDRTIRLWDLAAGREVQTREGHAGQVAGIAFAPDGRFVATAGEDERVRLWDVASAREVRQLQKPAGMEAGVEALAYAPDGKTVAGVAFATVYLWDAATGKELGRLKADNGARFSSLAFGPDGTSLVTGCWDNVLRLWDVTTGKEVRRFTGHQSAVWKVAYSPDGKRIASRSGRSGGKLDNSIRLWDATTGKELQRFDDVEDAQGGLAFSPNGKLLAASIAWDTIQLWDVLSGRPVRALSITKEQSPFGFPIAFSPDGRTLAMSNWNGNLVHVFEVATGGERCHFAGQRGPVRALAFSPDGKRLVSGGDDTTALVWDVTGRLSAPARTPPLPAAEVERFWANLERGSAVLADRALGELAAVPGQALPLVQACLVPTKPADAERVARWVRDLDSEAFAVREQAAMELTKLGDAAEPALRRALQDRPSLEREKRLQQLLDELADSSPRRLRQGRALELLERTDTAEARQVLQTLARGAPGTWLTEEASAALKRLGPKKGGP